MKKCKKCGALQNDERNTCMDCGTVLGHSLTEQETRLEEAALENKLDGMADRTDDFYVPLRDKIMGIICILGMAAAILLLTFPFTPNRHADLVQGFSLISLLSLAVSCFTLFFPKFMWYFSTLKYRLFYNWNTTPSDFAIVLRKVASYILFAMGFGCLLYAYLLYFQYI